jgi:cytochrome P450
MNNLLRHPRVYNKLKEEILSTFKTEEDIKVAVVTELPYLNACLEEGLRIFPPAPIGFLRAIQKGGDVIDGHQIPEGVSLTNHFSAVLANQSPDCRLCQHVVRPAQRRQLQRCGQLYSGTLVG